MTAPKDECSNTINYKTFILLLYMRIWLLEFGLSKKKKE